MFGRRAFSSDKEVYQFPTNGPGLRTYSGNLSMMYNYPQDATQARLTGLTPTTSMARRYSLQHYDPLIDHPSSSNYQASSFGTNQICDNLMNPSSLITNERILPYVPSSAQTTSNSLTSNMVLNNQLNLLDSTSTAGLHQPSQSQQARLMPRLPFKSHSTESKLIGGHSSAYLRTKPIVEPDGYFDTSTETTFTSGRRLSGK